MAQKRLYYPLYGLRTHYRSFLLEAGVDALLITAAYTIVFSARAFMTPLDYLKHLPAILTVAAVTVLMLFAFGVYHRIWSQTSGHGVSVILGALAASTVIVVCYVLLVTPRPLPLSVVLVGNIVATAALIAVRYRSRLVEGLEWRWRAVWHREFPAAAAPRTRALIIGAGESGQALAWRMKHRIPNMDYDIAGFIDDDPAKQRRLVEGLPVLGTRKDLVRVVAEEDIDLIIVAVHRISGAQFREILTLCEQTSARIKVVPDVFEMMSARGGSPLLRDVQPEDLIGRSSLVRHKDIDLGLISGRRILITGAAGSIGSELSRQILNYQPEQVVLLDNNESGLHDLTIELAMRAPAAALTPALMDVSSAEQMRAVFARHRPQIVLHAAAYKHVHLMEYYPNEALRVNVQGTLNVACAARDAAVERFVLISTDKAVNPTGVMGASKRVCELLLHALSREGAGGTLFTSVRFGNVLGSRGSIVPTFNKQIESGGPLTVTHPDMTRYFMSIPEAVNLILHAACLTQGDDMFILKMGEVVRIVELAERMIRMRGLRPYKDIDIVFTGVRPGEKMHEELYSPAERPSETVHPGIIKLDTWPQQFEATAFFDALDALLAGRYPTSEAALDGLRAAMEAAPPLRLPVTVIAEAASALPVH